MQAIFFPWAISFFCRDEWSIEPFRYEVAKEEI
jgi:hypothetical protein